MEYGRRVAKSRELYVEYIHVAECTCIFRRATKDTKFVEILGEAPDRGGMSLTCFAFLVSAYSAFIRLMQS